VASGPGFEQFPLEGVDLDHPNVARVYDYYLGGNANYAVDRIFGEKALDAFPFVGPAAKSNRLFPHWAVRYLVKQGVRQFVDIGSGVPTMGSTHQVADELVSDARVVYIDNEPVAVAHSQCYWKRTGTTSGTRSSGPTCATPTCCGRRSRTPVPSTSSSHWPCC
jgi:S-adenosyl methyltransferase